MTFWHGVFMVMTLGVVAFGVEKGLEAGGQHSDAGSVFPAAEFCSATA